MSQDQKSIQKTDPEDHATKIWGSDASNAASQATYSVESGPKKGTGSEYNVTEIALSSHALDRMLSRLKMDISAEQEAMDELIIRLRKRAG